MGGLVFLFPSSLFLSVCDCFFQPLSTLKSTSHVRCHRRRTFSHLRQPKVLLKYSFVSHEEQSSSWR